jgi:hypothetical protein
MSKELYYNDVKLVITSDTDKNYKLYKVELTDRNGFQSTIYERSFNDAIEYAKYYFDTTEKRKNSYDSIGNMIEIDKKAGRNFPLD